MKNKTKRSQRRYKTYIHAKKQLQIKKNSYHIYDDFDYWIFQLGRYNKRNALDCGQSKCSMCGNPRNHKWNSKKNTLTLQELKSLESFKFSYLSLFSDSLITK